MKTVAISVLGTQKDAHGGAGPARWDTWRPTIGLVQQENLPIDELHLILNKEHMPLAERIKADIRSVSPETKVFLDIIQLKDPWDFEEVYGKFYDYAKSPCFHKERKNYYIHISTGSHVEQICLFLLAESRHLGGDLAKSALFGHKKGSYSGAGADHDGFLKEADGGIVFLDEIGELPLEAQAMLLKAIEEKTFRPLGAASGGSATGGSAKVLAALLGKGYASRFDEFDLVQLAHVVAICRESDSAASAAKRLFAVSRKTKKSNNDSDRLAKYLARFGLKFKDILAAVSP